MKQGEKEEVKIQEKELDYLYMYLNMYMDSMDEEEKSFWLKILFEVDEEFYDDTSDGADELQDVQGPEGGS